MLPLFILGIALLVGFLLLGRWYVSADPQTLVKAFKWTSLIALVVVGLFLMLTGKLAWALFTLPVLYGWFMRFRSFARTAKNFSKMASAATGNNSASDDDISEVETRFFRMVLNHASGNMDGEILEGSFKGRRLSELVRNQLLSLLDECQESDAQSVSVLEAYLDRLYGDWRRHDNHASGQGDGTPHSTDDRMDRKQALNVLGLSEEATDDEIKAAHHRLMSGMHPDHGGSTYLASKINQAKDVLLGN